MTTPPNWHAETFERVHDMIIHLRDTLPNQRSMLWFAVAPKDKDRIMDMYGLFNPQWRGFQYDVDELYLALQQLEGGEIVGDRDLRPRFGRGAERLDRGDFRRCHISELGHHNRI